jgi:hypothetical protein
MAAWAAGEIEAGELQQQVFGSLLGDFWQSRIEFQQSAVLREGPFLGSVSQEAEVTDAHDGW